MRHRSRSDPNHQELVAAFKRAGFKVRTVKWPADAVIAKNGRMAFVEFKRDEKAKLTDDQQALRDDGFPFVVACNIDDVSDIADAWRIETEWPLSAVHESGSTSSYVNIKRMR